MLVLLALLRGSLPALGNQLFLLFTFLTSATGLMIAPPGPPPSPAQITAFVALIALTVGLYAFMPVTWPGAGAPPMS